MATSTNAELLTLSGKRNPYPGKLGVVEPGAYADLLLVDGNPLVVRGVNLVGLRRRDFSAERIAAIREMHKLLYRQGKTLDEAREGIASLTAEMPGAAVQVMAGPHGRRRLLGEPVRRHVDVAAGVKTLVEPPARRQGRQVQGARSDVHVGDVLGGGLEGGERAA